MPTAAGWSAASNLPRQAASSGGQGGVFGPDANEVLELVMRGQALGMPPSELSRLGSMPLAQARQAVEKFEADQYLGDLGDPVYSPARTRDIETGNLQRGLSDFAAQQAAALAASQQLTPEQQAIEDQYGHDMAWLDPSFQYQATTMAPVTTQDAMRYGTTADPAAQALERQAIDQLFARSRQGASAGEQQALGQQQQAINRLFGVANQGATGEERSSLGRVSEIAAELRNRARVGATDDERAAIADQRRAMEQLFDDYDQGASDVELEAQATQREAMNELMGVWKGGGATALERARRARSRAEGENWLEGQRKADMQDLAERGMSGSGAELASLQADRQAAAQRLSMADLETDAALEERAMQALLSGSGVAGEMLAGEGGIQARRLQQLTGASNAARGISGTLGDIEGRGTQQLAASGGMETDVARTWGDIEQRVLAALQGANQGAASMAGTYGDIEQRALQALLGAQTGAGNMRRASDQFVQQNADRMSDAARFNADAINRSASENKAFIQNAYRDTMADRMRWDMQTRDLQTAVARDLLGSDIDENQFGFGQGYDTAASDVAARNRAQGNYNTGVQSAHSGSAPVIYDAQAGVNNAAQAGLRTGGQTIQQAGNAVLTYATGGMGGMGRQPYSSGGGGAVINPTDEQNPYRRGY